MTNLISAVILCFFLWGRSLHNKNIRLHIAVMLAVIVADYALVGYLVVNHNALGKVGIGMPWTLKLHVPIAVFTALLYLPTAWTGYQLYKGQLLHERMRFFDRILVPSRILTLLTSLMVQYFATR